MGYEYSQMLQMKKNIIEFQKLSHQVYLKIANRIALLAIRKVKKMTPVDTGDLRNNWKHDVIKKGDTYIIVIYNQLEYASFVEKGHRIVIAGKTVGWVEGRFMLELTMKQMELLAPNMLKKEMEKEMRRIFGS